VAPDDHTGAEAPGERVYHEVFNPAVFPYKRMTVLDAVDDVAKKLEASNAEIRAAAAKLPKNLQKELEKLLDGLTTAR